MTRRFSSLGVVDLERHAKNHPEDVLEIIEELKSYRTTRAARRLLSELESSQMVAPKRSAPKKNAEKKRRVIQKDLFNRNKPTPTNRKRARPGNWQTIFDYPATDEQEAAVDLFVSKQSMKISAFAGAGKTSTLKFLAATAPKERGLYLAFNKSIASEAKQSFRGNVECRTTHSAALRDVRPRFPLSRDKWFNSINAKQLASAWELEDYRAGPITLKPDMIAYLTLVAVRQFCQSEHDQLAPEHVQLLGRALGLPPERKVELNNYIFSQAEVLWDQMLSEDSDIPLGHDGYLKLWSLMEPKFAFDYVLLDEAQDTNPAVLSVLKNQDCQVIYVGDKHQQIYEWRGAVNAMAEIDAQHEAHLTTSFRFGPALAAEANRVLHAMGETQKLKGFGKVQTEIKSFGDARTVLTRSNAMLFKEVLEALNEERRPHVVGGSDQMKSLLRDVDALQNGKPGAQPEFFGFYNWNEVLEFVEEPEGEALLPFVTLVQSVGRGALWRAVLSCIEDEADADLVISTAHKAKGREWDSVRIAEDFSLSSTKNERIPYSEARLFYVAMTRAKRRLVVDPVLVSAFSGNLAPDQDLATSQALA